MINNEYRSANNLIGDHRYANESNKSQQVEVKSVNCSSVANKLMNTEAASKPFSNSTKNSTIPTNWNKSAQGASLANQGKVLHQAIGMSKMSAHRTSGENNTQQMPVPLGKSLSKPSSKVNTTSSNPLQNQAVKPNVLEVLQKQGIRMEAKDLLFIKWKVESGKIKQPGETLYVDKNTVRPSIACSVVHVPSGPQSGTYALTGKVIGCGGFNVATIAVNIETGELKVFRHGPKTPASEREIVVNNKLAKYPQNFAAGAAVTFKGDYLNPDKGSNLQNVEQVGILMDYCEGGELYERTDDVNKPPLTKLEKLEISLKIFESIALMHNEKIGSFDLKTENIFLKTKDGDARIGDFGTSRELGAPMMRCGTPGCMAPELAALGFGESTIATAAMDVYSASCLLTDIFGLGWYDHDGISQNGMPATGLPNELKPIDEFESRKEWCFYAREDHLHPDYYLDRLISKGLEHDPGKRPKVDDIIVDLQMMVEMERLMTDISPVDSHDPLPNSPSIANTTSSPPQDQTANPNASDVLKLYGMKLGDIARINRQGKEIKASQPQETLYVDKNTVQPSLACSLVHVPSGPQSGTYALTGKVIGCGGNNVASIAVNIETGQLKVFRHGPKTSDSENEIAINNRLAKYPDNFVVGASVTFRGDYYNPSNGDSLQNVEQVGILMDYCEGGEVGKRINDASEPPLTKLEKLEISLKHFESLALMHSENIGHFDQKVENTFLKTRNGDARIADFGYSSKIGDPIGLCGTPGCTAPELARLGYGETTKATTAMDMYSAGNLLADLFVPSWYDWDAVPQQGNMEPTSLYNEEKTRDDFESRKERCFNARENPTSSDYHLHKLISDCLAYDPSDRALMNEALGMLQFIISVEKSKMV